jgi:tetratricopeptide (TPR) repeat protein
MMLPRLKGSLVVIALSLLGGSSSIAQDSRPRIAKGADPNDWEAYYDAGIKELDRDLRSADSAFAFASRLRPDRAEPLYARWVAFWAGDSPRFARYLSGDEKVMREPEVVQAESLRIRAFRRNPFVHQGLVMYAYDRLPGRFRDNAITRGWISLGRAELPRALSAFGQLVERDPRQYGYLRFVRASAFVNIGRLDSAVAEVTALLAQLRAADAQFLVSEYQSKELLEYALGLLHLQLGKPAAARDAFGRAVVENAAFAPAHAMLGRMVMSVRNAESAATDLKLAIDIDPADVEYILGYGRALQLAKRHEEAVAEFRKAVALEPLYAASHFALAFGLEVSGDKDGAVAAYKTFLDRAAKMDPQRATAERKLQELTHRP